MLPVTCFYRYGLIGKLHEEFSAVRHWLSFAECRAFEHFRNPSRRDTWLAGRWLAKRLIADLLNNSNMEYSDVEIISAGHKPRALLRGQTLPWSLSIAHTSRCAMVALSCSPNVVVGVDLVEVRDYGRGFSALWFTSDECRRLVESGLRGFAVAWAIKEALYKAVNTGERFEPRNIETIPCGSSGGARWFRIGEKYCRCRLTLWQTTRDEIAVGATHYKGVNND